MDVYEFQEDAGEPMFEAGDGGVAYVDEAAADRARAAALKNRVRASDVRLDDLTLDFRHGVATVRGRARTQADREKVVLLVGNTRGVRLVRDRISVLRHRRRAAFHTVTEGETLGDIAELYFGDRRARRRLVRANRPLLHEPTDVYPGQVLRVPAEA